MMPTVLGGRAEWYAHVVLRGDIDRASAGGGTVSVVARREATDA